MRALFLTEVGRDERPDFSLKPFTPKLSSVPSDCRFRPLYPLETFYGLIQSVDRPIGEHDRVPSVFERLDRPTAGKCDHRAAARARFYRDDAEVLTGCEDERLRPAVKRAQLVCSDMSSEFDVGPGFSPQPRFIRAIPGHNKTPARTVERVHGKIDPLVSNEGADRKEEVCRLSGGGQKKSVSTGG